MPALGNASLLATLHLRLPTLVGMTKLTDSSLWPLRVAPPPPQALVMKAREACLADQQAKGLERTRYLPAMQPTPQPAPSKKRGGRARSSSAAPKKVKAGVQAPPEKNKATPPLSNTPAKGGAVSAAAASGKASGKSTQQHAGASSSSHKTAAGDGGGGKGGKSKASGGATNAVPAPKAGHKRSASVPARAHQKVEV